MEAIQSRHARADATEATLVRAAARGDRAAFGALWSRHAAAVRGILRTMVAPEEAEDLVQEVALSALSALPDLERSDRFGAWLHAIARNAGRNAMAARIARGGATLPAMERTIAARTAPASAATEAAEIMDEIHRLPECYRRPLLLRLVMRLSGPEIACRTGMTNGSVRVNLHRGFRLLRERLAAKGMTI